MFSKHQIFKILALITHKIYDKIILEDKPNIKTQNKKNSIFTQKLRFFLVVPPLKIKT